MSQRSDTIDEITNVAPQPLPNTGTVGEVNQPKWIAWLLNLISRISFRHERAKHYVYGTDVLGDINSNPPVRLTCNGAALAKNNGRKFWNATNHVLDNLVAGESIQASIAFHYNPDSTPEEGVLIVEHAPTGNADPAAPFGTDGWAERERVGFAVARSSGDTTLHPLNFDRLIDSDAARKGVRFWLVAGAGDLENVHSPMLSFMQDGENFTDD